MSLKSLSEKLAQSMNLSAPEVGSAISQIIGGDCPTEDVAGFLLALNAKGETATEIAGAANAVRAQMTQIRSARSDLLDTCGTGGDGAGTFNISTAAAIVAAAAGAHVAKHGNRSVSSKSGSADVLRELGVHIDASLAQVEQCLEQVGICFCYAPVMHPAMKSVADVRRQLGVPTIFNLLGPLCNPAKTPYQLLGVGRPELLPLMADVLQQLGCQRSVVVSGSDGLDEVSLATATNVRIVTTAGIEEAIWSPPDFGLKSASMAALRVAGPAASAAVIRGVLDGVLGPARDVVAMNAAAAIWTVGLEPNLKSATDRALTAIQDGSASEILARLVQCSHA